MPCDAALRRSARRQQGKPRAEHGQRARIPARPHDGQRPMLDGHLVDGVLMGMKRLSMQRGAVHDRNSLLKNLKRGFHDGIRRHAEERCIDITRLTDVGLSLEWTGLTPGAPLPHWPLDARWPPD